MCFFIGKKLSKKLQKTFFKNLLFKLNQNVFTHLILNDLKIYLALAKLKNLYSNSCVPDILNGTNLVLDWNRPGTRK